MKGGYPDDFRAIMTLHTIFKMPPRVLFGLLIFLLIPGGVAGADMYSDSKRKVLIIGIDGCRPDTLLAANTPNIDYLIQSGLVSYQGLTGDITLSGPGWASMFTGVWRQKHGVRDNSFRGARFSRYPGLFRRIKEHDPEIFTASLVHWAPIKDHIITHADISEFYKSDREVARGARRVLLEEDPDVLFLHFDDVDHAGHSYGYISPSYLGAIERTDEYVGDLLHALQRRETSLQEEWMIILVTDHGGSGRDHGKNTPANRKIFLIINGPGTRGAKIKEKVYIVDVAATVLSYLGIGPRPQWGLDGRNLYHESRTLTY